MEKPSAGSGILSRSRAKTAPNGGQPHSEDDSSEEEHSHGEPGGLGLKARWSGEGSWKVEEGGGESCEPQMVSAAPGLQPQPSRAWCCRHRKSTGWALDHPPPLCPQSLRELRMPLLDGLGPHTLQPCRGLRSDWTRYWEDTSMRSCEAHVVGRSPELSARLWSRSRGSPPSSHPQLEQSTLL